MRQAREGKERNLKKQWSMNVIINNFIFSLYRRKEGSIGEDGEKKRGRQGGVRKGTGGCPSHAVNERNIIKQSFIGIIKC